MEPEGWKNKIIERGKESWWNDRNEQSTRNWKQEAKRKRKGSGVMRKDVESVGQAEVQGHGMQHLSPF